MHVTSQNLNFLKAFDPAVPTGNTPIVSDVCDHQNFDGSIFVQTAGTIADTDMTTVVLLEESDDNVTYSAVADEDLIGTELGAALRYDSDNKTSKLGYKGRKRYTRGTITASGNTGNFSISGTWVRLNPRSVQSAQVA